MLAVLLAVLQASGGQAPRSGSQLDLYDVTSCSRVASARGIGLPIENVFPSADGGRGLVYRVDGSLDMVMLPSLIPIWHASLPAESRRCIAEDPHKRIVAVGGDSGRIDLLDDQTGKSIAYFYMFEPIDGMIAASSS